MLLDEKASPAVLDHFRHTRHTRGNNGHGRRHGFHDHGREVVLAAGGLVNARQCEDARPCKEIGDLGLAFRARDLDARISFGCRTQFRFERAFADDLAFKRAVAELPTSGDEIGETFLLDVATDREDERRLRLLAWALEGSGLALVVAPTLTDVAGPRIHIHPVAGLPHVTLAAGGQVAIVTQGPTPLDPLAAIKLDGDVVDELEAVVAALGPQV